MLTADNKTFCYECLNDVLFITIYEERYGSIKGEKCRYEAKVAHCIHCNNVLDVYNDENLKLLYDSYRNAHGLISLEKIRAIPEMYNIGKGVLSSLLKWGANTFSRYYNGYLPTNQYSDVLKRLYDNPSDFFAILEEGKHNLSDVAYKKSSLALQKLINAAPIQKCESGNFESNGKTLSIELPEKLYYDLTQASDRYDLSVASLVRMYCSQCIEREKPII